MSATGAVIFLPREGNGASVMLQELLAIDDDYRERLLVETANVTPEDVLDEARRLYSAEFPQVKASLAGKRMLKAVKARIERFLLI